jgi:hypothetical protein
MGFRPDSGIDGEAPVKRQEIYLGDDIGTTD